MSAANWCENAVFYEVLVRTFQDSNGDGVGDFEGLESRLDYLQWLGVDCLWLPPFFASPLDDGGYDVADFLSTHPDFGSVEQLSHLLDAAHARGMRVIADLPLNHTSIAHQWWREELEALRAIDAGTSDAADFTPRYVWSTTGEEYADARVIFEDTETSNWTFEPSVGRFYWHRFFSHQPDLNYDNPAVQEDMLDVLRFWLSKGLDGFRLDAVPYLYERHGTNGENLPETHAYLARVRAMVDEEFPGRVLIAEANQWPRDVVDYFGSDEAPECHMCFHFPLMPRIFLSFARGEASSIDRILTDTPQLPAGAVWGTFLRNHDELTLEMVDDVERADLYARYAPEPRMRANVGIRRRLLPLLGSAEAVECAVAMLLSMPGAPFLYYGDEIGMADDIWLVDRDGVRTPMQWDGSTNAGFSPQSSYPPVLSTVPNVQAALADPTSLLYAHRRLIAQRKAVFDASDDWRIVASDEVFAFERAGVLCAFNVTAEPQSVTVAGIEVYLPGHGYAWVPLVDRVLPHLVGQRFYGGSADSSGVQIVRAESWQFGGVWLTVESAGAFYRTLVDATGRDLLAQYAADGGGDDAAGAGVDLDVVGYVRGMLAERGHTLVGDVRAQRVGGEQSNTSFVVGSWVVKFQRRLAEGVNPEVLVADALADCPHAAHVVAHDEGACVATVVPLVDGARDGWELALERGLVGDDSGEGVDVAGLGAAIACVHAALDEGHVQRRENLLDCLRERMVRTGTQAGLGDASKTGLLEVLANAGAGDDQVPVQRVHGDLHLGQVLWDSSRWVLIDFEGEPAATPAERAAEHSPMKDLAGMIRSFDYATQVRARENTASDSTPADAGAGAGVVEQATQALLDGYRQAGGTVDEALLQAYLLDKALYEYDYELHYRPDFRYIPARALRALGIATPE